MFVVIQTSSVPEHLRGYMGRFLQQVGSDIYVGKVSRKVADTLWKKLCEVAGDGSLTMITSANNDCGFDIALHGVNSTVLVDMDGIHLPAEFSPKQKS